MSLLREVTDTKRETMSTAVAKPLPAATTAPSLASASIWLRPDIIRRGALPVGKLVNFTYSRLQRIVKRCRRLTETEQWIE